MKKAVILPALLTVCSVVSCIVYKSPAAYFNLFLSVAIIAIVLISRSKVVQSRMKFSAMWLLTLELAALVLLLLGVNIYQPSLIWWMYAAFVALDICVTPKLTQEK